MVDVIIQSSNGSFFIGISLSYLMAKPSISKNGNTMIFFFFFFFFFLSVLVRKDT